MRILPLLLALAALAPPALAEGERKPDLPALVKFLKSFEGKKTLGKKDPEVIGKRLEGVAADDLSWVLDRLREREEKDRGPASAEVEGLVEDALLSARWSPGILRLPGAAKRFADPSDEARCALLADVSRLEDAEPATRLALGSLSGGSLPVRLRAVDVLADLAAWGGDAARLVPALEKTLEDPSPALRDLALERLADMATPKALEWSLAHLGEDGEEEAVVRGKKEVRRPGDRALRILNQASRNARAMEPEAFRMLSAEDRAAVAEGFREWMAGVKGNPLRDAGEGPFDPVSKNVSGILDPKKSRDTALKWWSDIERAQFRLDLEDVEVREAESPDPAFFLQLTVFSLGMRPGSWEAFVRGVRCGNFHRLPRRGYALVETTIQPLLDGRWKIWVRAYEWRN